MIVDILFFLIVTAIMFLPTIIANQRGHKNTTLCFWINLFLGWSVIFWLPLLAWSLLSRSQ